MTKEDKIAYAKIIEKILLERGYFCEMCKRPLSILQCHPRQRQIHHIVPKRLGGEMDESNLFLCCRECHMVIEFLIKGATGVEENKTEMGEFRKTQLEAKQNG